MTLVRFQGLMVVDKPLPKVLERCLYFTRSLTPQQVAAKEERAPQDHAIAEKPTVSRWQKQPLFTVQYDKNDTTKHVATWIHAGMYDELLLNAQEHGWTFTVLDKRKPMPEVTKDYTLVSWFPGQLEAVEAILKSGGMGIIDAPTAFGKSFVICQLCSIWGRARVAVVAASEGVFSMFYSKLEEAFPGHVTRAGQGFTQDPRKRILVTMAHSLHTIDNDWPDVMICDEVHNYGSEMLSDKAGFFYNTPRFGLSASTDKRGDGASKLIHAVFGPTIFTRTYQESQADGRLPPVDVWMYDIRGCSEINRGVFSDAQYLRKNVWENSVRNQIMVNVAKHVLHRADSPVLMICKTTEHVLILRKMLGGNCEVVYGKTSLESIEEFKKMGLWDEGCVEKPDSEAVRAKLNGGWKGIAVATLKWSEGVDIPDLKYVFRLDALASRIKSDQIPGRAVRPKALAIVVDCFDSFSFRLKANSQARVKEYESKGWRVIMVE